MKLRYRFLLNFFSISILLFALYLNFIKKEVADTSALIVETNSIKTGKEVLKADNSSDAPTQPAHIMVVK